jgi:hypothetical protein
MRIRKTRSKAVAIFTPPLRSGSKSLASDGIFLSACEVLTPATSGGVRSERLLQRHNVTVLPHNREVPESRTGHPISRLTFFVLFSVTKKNPVSDPKRFPPHRSQFTNNNTGAIGRRYGVMRKVGSLAYGRYTNECRRDAFCSLRAEYGNNN